MTKEIRLEGSGGLNVYADVVRWSEQQAMLLRRVGAGEKINDQVEWENVAEEIEALGQSERRGLASRIRTVIEHLAKLEAPPSRKPRASCQDTILRTRADH